MKNITLLDSRSNSTILLKMFRIKRIIQGTVWIHNNKWSPGQHLLAFHLIKHNYLDNMSIWKIPRCVVYLIPVQLVFDSFTWIYITKLNSRKCSAKWGKKIFLSPRYEEMSHSSTLCNYKQNIYSNPNAKERNEETVIIQMCELWVHNRDRIFRNNTGCRDLDQNDKL